MKKTDAFLKSLFAFVLFSAFALAAVAAPFKTPFTKKRVLCDAAQCCDCSFELADSGYPLAPAAEQKSGAKEIFDLVSPELIEFFEQNFAKCDLITGMKPQRVQKLMKAYGVSEKKLYALIAIQFVCRKNGTKATLTSLSKMSVPKLMSLAREEFTKYYNNLPEEEKEQINKNFEKHKERHGVPKI
jgi:hypothetical protein